MNVVLLFSLAFGGGFLLGILYFGGLWWTLEHHFRSKNALPWLLGSNLIRMAVLLTGLFYIASGDWIRALVGLLGVMIGRFVITHLAHFSKPMKIHAS